MSIDRKTFKPGESKGPSPESGTLPWDYAGIKPQSGSIAKTPAENAKNDQVPERMSKGQPFGKGGSGYTG